MQTPRGARGSSRAPLTTRALALSTVLIAAACGGEARDGPEPAGGADTLAVDTLRADSASAAVDTLGPSPVATGDDPCPCVDRTLDAYYGEADEVLLGRLAGTRASGGDLLLDFTLTERPWKLARPPGSAPAQREVMTVAMGAPTSACGVELHTGGLYVVFARGSTGTGIPRAGACGGTRAVDGLEHQTFQGVPADSIVVRLDALSGLDVQRAAAENTPDASDWDNEALVGLVELPALNVGEVVPLRTLPDAAAPVERVLDSWVDVAASEVGYEVPAAVVVARAEDWYRIRLADGTFGWVAPLDAGAWTPFERLAVSSLAYLTEAWSGHIWPEAGGGVPVRSPRKGAQEREEYHAEVHEARWLGETLWFRIDLLASNPCLAGETEVELSGWVPAYGPGGEPAVWYYSRGC